jgi:hypothetical protein
MGGVLKLLLSTQQLGCGSAPKMSGCFLGISPDAFTYFFIAAPRRGKIDGSDVGIDDWDYCKRGSMEVILASRGVQWGADRPFLSC